ncbi:hypothetical protein ACFX2I_043905 [Malus domestica]
MQFLQQKHSPYCCHRFSMQRRREPPPSTSSNSLKKLTLLFPHNHSKASQAPLKLHFTLTISGLCHFCFPGAALICCFVLCRLVYFFKQKHASVLNTMSTGTANCSVGC